MEEETYPGLPLYRPAGQAYLMPQKNLYPGSHRPAPEQVTHRSPGASDVGRVQ